MTRALKMNTEDASGPHLNARTRVATEVESTAAPIGKTPSSSRGASHQVSSRHPSLHALPLGRLTSCRTCSSNGVVIVMFIVVTGAIGRVFLIIGVNDSPRGQ